MERLRRRMAIGPETVPDRSASVQPDSNPLYGPVVLAIHVLRSSSSVRIVAAETVWLPPLPRTVTVAARPDGVRVATFSPFSVPSVTGFSRRPAWAAVKRAVQSWYGERLS